MPEIDIGEDKRGRAEFVIKPLQGEDTKNFNRTRALVSVIESYLKSNSKSVTTANAESYLTKANDMLASIITHDAADKLLDARLNNKIGSKATFIFRGKTEDEGFILEDLVIAEGK